MALSFTMIPMEIGKLKESYQENILIASGLQLQIMTFMVYHYLLFMLIYFQGSLFVGVRQFMLDIMGEKEIDGGCRRKGK